MNLFMCEQPDKKGSDLPLRDIIADEISKARISVDAAYRDMARRGVRKAEDNDAPSSENAPKEPVKVAA